MENGWMHVPKMHLIAALLASVLGCEAAAQATTPNNAEERKRDAYAALASPPNLSFGTLAGMSYDTAKATGIQVLLEGSDDTKTGKVALGWKSGQGLFRLTLTGPLDQKTKEATPLTLDGLTGGAAAELSFNKLQWRGINEAEQLEFDDLCRRTLHEETCDVSDLPEEYRPKGYRLHHYYDKPWLFGGSVTVGRNVFAYRDGADLTAATVSRNDWSSEGRAGVFSRSLGFVIASYSYSRRFKAGGAPTQLCQPLTSHRDTLRCDTVVIGAPTKKTSSVATLQIRRFFKGGAAIVPTIQRDFESDVTAISVPAYFLKNDKGGATGGVRAGWRSDTKAVTISVFVGGAVALLP